MKIFSYFVENFWTVIGKIHAFGALAEIIFKMVNGVATAVITLAGTIIVGAGRVGDDVGSIMTQI